MPRRKLRPGSDCNSNHEFDPFPESKPKEERNTYSSHVGEDVFKQWGWLAKRVNTPISRDIPPLVPKVPISWSKMTVDDWSTLTAEEWANLGV